MLIEANHNSFLTAALLDQLHNNPTAQIEAVIKRANKSVREKTNGKQRVWCNSTLIDEESFKHVDHNE